MLRFFSSLLDFELARPIRTLTCPQWLYQLLRESEVHG